jgi:hypothetical protein
LIGYSYLVVFLFLSVFFLFLSEAARLNPGLGNPRWPLLIAGILVLPLLLPAFRYVAPYIKSIKISDFEVSFTQAEVASYSLATLTGQLKTPTEQVSAPEYAQMMAIRAKPDCVCALQRKRLQNFPAGLGMTFSPVRFEAKTCEKLRRFPAIFNGIQRGFSATQTVWRRERDSNSRYSFKAMRQK